MIIVILDNESKYDRTRLTGMANIAIYKGQIIKYYISNGSVS